MSINLWSDEGLLPSGFCYSHCLLTSPQKLGDRICWSWNTAVITTKRFLQQKQHLLLGGLEFTNNMGKYMKYVLSFRRSHLSVFILYTLHVDNCNSPNDTSGLNSFKKRSNCWRFNTAFKKKKPPPHCQSPISEAWSSFKSNKKAMKPCSSQLARLNDEMGTEGGFSMLK